jgi:heme/copper-type cytochrome/quinol oxidase subunit 2
MQKNENIYQTKIIDSNIPTTKYFGITNSSTKSSKKINVGLILLIAFIIIIILIVFGILMWYVFRKKSTNQVTNVEYAMETIPST